MLVRNMPLVFSCTLLLFSCGDKDQEKKNLPATWAPVLGQCEVVQAKNCFLSDKVNGLIWSSTQEDPLPQKDAQGRCRAMNMRLPTFREYALSAKNGMLHIERTFPGFGDVQSLLWIDEPQTYIAFSTNSASKRQGQAPARFKCVTGESIPSPSPSHPGPDSGARDTSLGGTHPNRCQELETLQECGANSLCVWSYQGCVGIEAVVEPRPS